MAMQLQRTIVKGRSMVHCMTNNIWPAFQITTINKYYTGTKGSNKPGAITSQEASGASNAKASSHGVHMTSVMQYPLAEALPLPENIEDIDAAEKAQFSPQRSRDISGPVILCKTVGTFGGNGVTSGFNQHSYPSDPHVASYDCQGAISLNSAMQTNVPDPFSARGKATHLNMPGGQWGQGFKYMADDLQNSHHTNITERRSGNNESQGSGSSGTLINESTPGKLMLNQTFLSSPHNQDTLSVFPYFRKQAFSSCIPLEKIYQLQTHISYSTSVNDDPSLTRKEKLKRFMKEYGATVTVFHVSISLLSLGGFYLAVSSGIDMSSILKSLGAGEVAAGASTFVMAYAIHKVFAPVRISITLTATPFIVRYLRRVGFLKLPKSTPS